MPRRTDEQVWTPIDLRNWPELQDGTWTKGSDAAAEQRYGEQRIRWHQDAEDERCEQAEMIPEGAA
jgi:hypothetical protein